MENILKIAKEVIENEADVIKNLSKNINEHFGKAVLSILNCKGKVVISGMGKAGLIGKKIASTFSSLGTSSFFMHPAEASHGDLGMLTREDVVILLSNSGESFEISSIIPSIKSIGSTIIAITGKTNSTLAKQAHLLIHIGDIKEVDQLGLAPTTSTTAMLVIGDALAIATVRQNKNWSKEDFAFFHPGGSLGKKLLKVKKVMETKENNVLVKKETFVKEVLLEISEKKTGCAIIIDAKEHIIGIFSDGDLRRHLKQNENLLKQPIEKVMTKNPKTITDTDYALEAVKIMKDYKIADLPVIDKSKKIVGLISIKDLIAIGLL